MKSTLQPAFFIFTALILSSSCNKERGTTQAVSNAISPASAPLANAGNDTIIILPANNAYLTGLASTDPDNNIASYAWTKISGPAACTIAHPDAVSTQVYDLAAGVYQFALKVKDNSGLFAADTVAITVKTTDAGWTRLQYLPEKEFFFGPRDWFDGSNFLMGIEDNVYSVSSHGGVWKYNSLLNGWVSIGAFPEQMKKLPIVFSTAGKGYCIGDGHCWQYNPVANQWVQKNNPPANSRDPLIIGNKVYLRDNNKQLWAYDPATDLYTQKNNIPDVGNELLGSFVLNERGYYIGEDGRSWYYDAVADTWTQKADFDLAGSVFSTSSFSLKNYGYIIGDLNRTTYNKNQPMKLWRYDPAADKWNMSTENYTGFGAYAISTVSFNGIVYAGLGFNNGDFDAIDFWSFK